MADKKTRITIYLKSGEHFNLEASLFSIRYDTRDGKLTSTQWEDATGEVPMYLDYTAVEAIVQHH